MVVHSLHGGLRVCLLGASHVRPLPPPAGAFPTALFFPLWGGVCEEDTFLAIGLKPLAQANR